MKNKIIESASTLFNQKGYFQTSMDDIAAHAEVAKGTLYYYFKNKAELFGETVIDGIHYLGHRIQSIVGTDDCAKVIAYKIIEVMVDLCMNNKEIVEVVMSQVDVGIQGDVISKINEEKNKLIDWIAEIIHIGEQDGEIRTCDSRLVAQAMISYIYHFSRSAAQTGQYNQEQIVHMISTLLMEGMLK